jgi:hypothetical protein
MVVGSYSNVLYKLDESVFTRVSTYKEIYKCNYCTFEFFSFNWKSRFISHLLSEHKDKITVAVSFSKTYNFILMDKQKYNDKLTDFNYNLFNVKKNKKVIE